MRNLKKVLSVLLVVAMLATAMVPAFAADTATISADAKIAADLGMLLGTGSGVTAEYTATGLTRVQAAILLLRLKGLEADAKAFKTTDNFADVKADAWYAPITAYLKANPALGFIGDGKNFNAEEPINAQQYYKVVLTALGYEIADGKDSSFEKVLEFAKTKGLVKLDATKKQLTVDDLAVATVEGLKTAVKGGTTTLVATLAAKDAAFAAKATAVGLITVIKDFEVSNKAKTITVKLGAVPADATKVTIDVTKDGGLKVATIANFTQDATDKTLFTYTAAGSLVTGDYKVAVKDDAKDLGSKTFKVTDEKIAKIEITSTQIVRSSTTDGKAYYKVYNQYNEDVTKLPIASSIKFNSTISNVGTNYTDCDGKGTLEFHRDGTNSSDKLEGFAFSNVPVVVSLYDTSTGVVVTKSLTVSNTIGDIQSINIKGIVGNKALEKNSSETYYLDFEAKDSTGNVVTDFDTLNAALTLYPTSSSLINVTSYDDSGDYKVQLSVISTSDVSPYAGVGIQNITLIANGTGKSATYNVEVKLNTVLDQFILQRPAVEVTDNMGYVEIPFVALDSKGAQTTLSSKVNATTVTLTPSGATKFKFMPQTDGTTKLYYNVTEAKDATVTLTAQVNSSYKNSTVTFTVKGASKPDSLSSTIPFDYYLTEGASTEKGFNDIKVLDNNGVTVDLKKYNSASTGDTNKYFVTAVILNGSDKIEFAKDTAGVDKNIAYSTSKKIKFQATAKPGSADVKFQLYSTTGIVGDLTDASVKTVGNSITKTFYNVDPADITDYAIDTVATLWASDISYGTTYSQQWKADFIVRGLLSNGTKVRIPLIPADDATTKVGVVRFDVSDSAFSVTTSTYSTPASIYDNYSVGSAVYAYNDKDNSTETFAAKLTAIVRGYNRVITTKTADVKADESSRTATAIAINILELDKYSGLTNIPVKTRGTDTYVISKANFDTYFLGANRTMFKYAIDPSATSMTTAALGTDNGSDATRAPIYFQITDQYGKSASRPTYIQVVTGADKYTITNGCLSAIGGVASVPGDVISIIVQRDGISRVATIVVE